jgi:hypothetical protein
MPRKRNVADIEGKAGNSVLILFPTKLLYFRAGEEWKTLLAPAHK